MENVDINVCALSLYMVIVFGELLAVVERQLDTLYTVHDANETGLSFVILNCTMEIMLSNREM